MEVIPAIDLLDGKAVRLMKGRYEDVTVYHDDPPVLAEAWAGQVKRLHVVDLVLDVLQLPLVVDLLVDASVVCETRLVHVWRIARIAVDGSGHAARSRQPCQ